MSAAAPRASRTPGAIDTVLFDLDGTLADTVPDLCAALNLALAEAGAAPIAPARLRTVVSGGARAMVEQALPAGSGGLQARVHERFLALYAGAPARLSALFPGVDALLDRLERRDLRWGVVTNKHARFAAPLMRALVPGGRAACVVCGDSTRHAKPHPEPLLRACRELGSRPWRCVYVGDAERDVLAGRRAGMRTLVAAYGYLGAGERPDAWGADAVIDEPTALLPWLDGR